MQQRTDDMVLLEIPRMAQNVILSSLLESLESSSGYCSARPGVVGPFGQASLACPACNLDCPAAWAQAGQADQAKYAWLREMTTSTSLLASILLAYQTDVQKTKHCVKTVIKSLAKAIGRYY